MVKIKVTDYVENFDQFIVRTENDEQAIFDAGLFAQLVSEYGEPHEFVNREFTVYFVK